jgi:thioredoxin 1
MEPSIHALAGDYVGKVSVGKLNVDDNPSVTMRYMVRGIPTVILFKGGEIVDQVVGLVDKGTLKQMVDKHL